MIATSAVRKEGTSQAQDDDSVPPNRHTRRFRPWLRNVLGALVVLWAAASITFLLQTMTPGSRATLLLNLSSGESRERSPEELAPVNEKYGFTDPLWRQYLDYLGGLLRGDLGTSYQLQEPVLSVIADQIVPTLVLTVGALLIAWTIVVVVTASTAGRSGWISGIGSLMETVAAGLPHYWLGAALLVVFAINLDWFPVESGGGLAGLVLPVLTLAVPLSGFLGQVTREEFTRSLDEPYVLSARARGVGDLATRLRHVLRHSLIPALSVSGWALGALFSGAVIAETVFAREGIGQTLVTAANARDVPLVSGIVIFVAAVYVLANLLVDVLYSLVDPRIVTS